MGNSLRCCLACILPCGALDLIRIVHLNGYVEEITRPITAGEVLQNYPTHILSKPSSQGVVRRILILSPNTQLKRGSIYFLIPSATFAHKSSKKLVNKNKINAATSDSDSHVIVKSKKKKLSTRPRGRVGVWRPHLETICED